MSKQNRNTVEIEFYAKRILGLFEDYTMQTVIVEYTRLLRQHIKTNPGHKEAVINALELFLQELKNSK